jgi:NAD(P)-dependent dehydrogenase (short-subunit alcohol dehydrogenase family)
MAEKIALVTGASSGFGLLTSIELAKAGYRVMATMRDLGRRERLEQAVGAAGGGANIEIRALDVTKFDAIQGFVDTVVQDYGRLDVLVNNAGFAVSGFAEDIKLDELRLQFETNFFGGVAMTKAALPTMRRQRCGHIIQVSSISGLHGAITVSSFAVARMIVAVAQNSNPRLRYLVGRDAKIQLASAFCLGSGMRKWSRTFRRSTQSLNHGEYGGTQGTAFLFL